MSDGGTIGTCNIPTILSILSPIVRVIDILLNNHVVADIIFLAQSRLKTIVNIEIALIFIILTETSSSPSVHGCCRRTLPVVASPSSPTVDGPRKDASTVPALG